MSRRAMKILPDSTGKDIGLYGHIELAYTGAAALDAFRLNDVVTGETSGVEGRIGKVIPATVSTGTLIIVLSRGYEESSFSNGENLLVSAATIAQASGTGTVIYVPKNHVVGANNPDNGLYVNQYGSARITFRNGSPTFDAYSRFRTSLPVTIAEYMYSAVFDDPYLFYSASVNSGSAAIETTSKALLLSTNTLSGSSIKHATNHYHEYAVGQSQACNMSVQIGDTGKANVVRRWGMFDENDGLYFMLSGSGMYLVARTSIGGSPAETIISQSAWSTDRFDGNFDTSNQSGLALDVSKPTLYWITYQWPAGIARWGIHHSDGQLEAHEHIVSDLATICFTSPKLPVHYEQVNLNTAGSTSEMRVWTAVVATEGTATALDDDDLERIGNYDAYGIVVSGSETPLLVQRPVQYYEGLPNKSTALPNMIKFRVQNTATPGNPVRLKVSYYRDMTVATPSWESVYQHDRFQHASGTKLLGGTYLGADFIDGNEDVKIEGSLYDGYNVRTNYDLTTSSFGFTVKTIDPNVTASIAYIYEWEEHL